MLERYNLDVAEVSAWATAIYSSACVEMKDQLLLICVRYFFSLKRFDQLISHPNKICSSTFDGTNRCVKAFGDENEGTRAHHFAHWTMELWSWRERNAALYIYPNSLSEGQGHTELRGQGRNC